MSPDAIADPIAAPGRNLRSGGYDLYVALAAVSVAAPIVEGDLGPAAEGGEPCEERL